MKLDFGSGHNPRKGYKTCDITLSPFLDYIFDPITYKVNCDDNMFDEIYIKNVIHHVKNLDKLFAELNRILTNDGKLIIIEPSKEYYIQNVNLDILWYRGIIQRKDIWICTKYRNFKQNLIQYFKVHKEYFNNEKQTVIGIKQ